MTVTEINMKTGKKTVRDYTEKELSDIELSKAADKAARENRFVSDDELALEHIKSIMTQADKAEAMRKIREREK